MSDDKYTNEHEFTYHSPRYKKSITVEKGFRSDGASGPAIDIYSKSWWVHDKLCRQGYWDDGGPISCWQASRVMADILKSEGRHIRGFYWFWTTFFVGPKHLRNKSGWVKARHIPPKEKKVPKKRRVRRRWGRR